MFLVCRKPSGVNYVQVVRCKEEAVLYDVAIREIFNLASDAEKEVRKLEKLRRKRHKALVASQIELIREEQPQNNQYI